MSEKTLLGTPTGRYVKTSINLIPYQAFIPNPLPPELPPPGWELVALLEQAGSRLSELAGVGRNLPDPNLLVQPFIRREAVLSSMIEGTRTGYAQLVAFETTKKVLPGLGVASPPELESLEVLNHVNTIELGISLIKGRPLNLDIIRQLQARLLKGVRRETDKLGVFRDQQNFVGPTDDPADAFFFPPPVPDCDFAMRDLELYIQAGNGYPQLVRLAMIHYQFETIHPFVDGNGRVGRLIIPLLMVQWGLLPSPLLYLSAYLESRRRIYYDLLNAVRVHGDWQSWISFFLEGVRDQSADALKRAKLLLDLQSSWRKAIISRHRSTVLLEIVDLLFTSPILTASTIEEKLNISREAANQNIKKLLSMSILKPCDDSDYGRSYAAEAILEILKE